MRIALCTDWTKETALTARIKECFTATVTVDYFENSQSLSEAICITAYDAVVIALGGAKGMEAVILARGRSPTAEIVWLTDDEQFGKMAYHQRVAMMLSADCTAAELANGLKTTMERRKHREDCFVRGQPGSRADCRIIGTG